MPCLEWLSLWQSVWAPAFHTLLRERYLGTTKGYKGRGYISRYGTCSGLPPWPLAAVHNFAGHVDVLEGPDAGAHERYLGQGRLRDSHSDSQGS